MEYEKESKLEISHIGTKRWHLNGRLHRLDGPAVEHANGNKYWYVHGKLHREGGPAIIFSNGGEVWHKNGFYYEPTAHELMLWQLRKKNQG